MGVHLPRLLGPPHIAPDYAPPAEMELMLVTVAKTPQTGELLVMGYFELLEPMTFAQVKASGWFGGMASRLYLTSARESREANIAYTLRPDVKVPPELNPHNLQLTAHFDRTVAMPV